MMRYLLTLIFAVSGLALVKAEPIPLTDTIIIPGERVGPITKGMTFDELKARLGGADTPDATLATLRPFAGKAGDDPIYKIRSIFAGTDQELKVVTDPASGKILQAVLVGKAWTPPYDLKLGMSVGEVEKANEKSFKVLGFGWFSGGGSDFHGGKLEGQVEVYFWPENNSKPYDAGKLGIRQGWLSSDGDLRNSSAQVREIGVVIALPDKPVQRGVGGEIYLPYLNYRNEVPDFAPLTDTTIVPGQRVGPITRGMTLDQLKAILGVAELPEARLTVPYSRGDRAEIVNKAGQEGKVHEVFAGTDRELRVVSDPFDGRILRVVLVGDAWTPPYGLKVDMTVPEVEKLNGRPFKVLSFDWAWGGGADFRDGKIGESVQVCFRPVGVHREVLGGQWGWLPSDGAMRDSGSLVLEIAVAIYPQERELERDEKGEIATSYSMAIAQVSANRVTDTAVIPGERVGLITKGMTLDELKKRIGVEKLLEARLPNPFPLGPKASVNQDGKLPEVHSVFPFTDRELKVLSDPVSGKILQVVLVGRAWTPPFDLKKEATVEQVEKANGRPFKMLAFDWGQGGGADFHEGKLDGLVQIYFHTGPGSNQQAVMGMSLGWVPSDGALRDSGVTVEEIAVVLSPPETPVLRDEKGEIIVR